MTPSLEGWPIKAKEAPSPDEVRLAPLDTNPVFKNLGEKDEFFFFFLVKLNEMNALGESKVLSLSFLF